MTSIGHPEELLAALDPQQQEVALQVGGPLCVRAGAGTGKTRAITYRIAYGISVDAFEAPSVLAVTFTARAAAEMRSRLRQLGAGRVQARTFHAAALRQLTYFWDRAFSGSRPELISHKASLVATAASRVGVSVDKTMVRDLAAEVEWAKVSMIGIGDYPQASRRAGREAPGGVSDEDFMRVYEAYEAAKAERGVIDFEDVLALTCGILSEHEEIALRVRKQYRTFVVDEYQDVSKLQQHLLDLWRGDRRDICVVGDVSQTIYSFAGASPGFLVDFPKRFPEGRVVELNRDYRSTPQVVAVANQVMSHARGREGAVRLISQRSGGAAVEFRDYPTDDEEAVGVAERILALKAQGTPLSQMAILYRTNAQSEAFEKALTDRGIGVQIHGGARFFEREEVRRAVVLLRQAARLKTLVAGEAPPEAADGSLTEDVENIAGTLGWSPEPPTGAGAVRDRWENLEALVSLARGRVELTLEQFVAELEERAEAQAAPEVNGVTLSTLHAAKGLEWGAVFLTGTSEGLLPISLAEIPEAIEEERRLLYVGVTRAKDFLQISWALRRGGGRSQRRKVSRFLAPMWPTGGDGHSIRTGRTQSVPTARQRLQAEKDTFDTEADSVTKGLFEELRKWRLAQAKAASKPAFAIMPDVTLRDIAVAKPKTLRQLEVLRGIGQNRLVDFGAEILRVIREYMEDSPDR